MDLAAGWGQQRPRWPAKHKQETISPEALTCRFIALSRYHLQFIPRAKNNHRPLTLSLSLVFPSYYSKSLLLPSPVSGGAPSDCLMEGDCDN